MLSSEGKPTETEPIGSPVLSVTQSEWGQGSEHEQTFRLIETILSFEVCLYHQILPLKLEDNNLLLGMVNTEDSAALDYVSRILSYMNCTMVKTPITAEAHRSILSAYLNYKNTSPIAAKQLPKTWGDFTQNSSTAETTDSQHNQQPTISPIEDSNSSSKTRGDSNPFVVTSLTASTRKQETSSAAVLGNLPVLLVPVPEKLVPVETLPSLPPKKLLEQLLGRVLAGGIGRLYLERQPYQGRILWSENGILQSVLEKLPLSVFQGVLNELKRSASLSIATLSEPRQVEKECLFQDSRLLLRLRVMPGIYGEEATLQVLRGAALKFYQQQQLARLSRDALGISQQLSYKLHELQERLVVNHKANSGEAEAFDALNQLLDNLDDRIKNLGNKPEPLTKGE
ncbi:MAG: pilus assembly protein PilB [Cyanomargarita calcarea GSE-NOS-MK-12-04C]|jgi:type II secretory ATPase GspE/PulE/Tfp pilus assembly ATPase PilB-like protein|uniref:Pilus assembly protein PilB n=1 Tax=Cyanomargarita calcarea GSE-NOS-MK-12-04C TaxID=2839659 RepID=A0A951QVC1_9CYAN|nr:pilus assembly protein PilB [Cyanomargarita calcarea GSE-NOS-MK-12-04C]